MLRRYRISKGARRAATLFVLACRKLRAFHHNETYQPEKGHKRVFRQRRLLSCPFDMKVAPSKLKSSHIDQGTCLCNLVQYNGADALVEAYLLQTIYKQFGGA